MTDVIDTPLALGSLVEILRGTNVGRQALVVDRHLAPVATNSGQMTEWRYSLWVDEPGHEVVVRHSDVSESKAARPH